MSTRSATQSAARSSIEVPDGAPPASETFGEYGRALGLSEERIVDALCVALELVGPAVGGRYLGLGHLVEDDEPSRVATKLLQVVAAAW